MKTKRSISLLSIFMIIVFTGCGGATPISPKKSGAEQYPKTKYLYVKNNNTTQNYESKIKAPISEDEITWGGNKNTDVNTLYLISLGEYVQKEFPTRVFRAGTISKSNGFYSQHMMAYSSMNTFCNQYNERRINESWSARNYNPNNHNTGIAVCSGKWMEEKKLDINFYNFLTDQKKLSIFTNYLITKKYKLEKDTFEKTSSFQKRVQYVKDNIQSITNKYMSIAYNEVYGQPIIEETNYDADNELFYGVLKSSQGKLSEKIAVSVPLAVARNFYNADKDAKVIYEYKNGKVYLKNIIISYGSKKYMAVLNKMNYKPSELKVALYQDIEYGEKLIAKLNNDIPKLLKQAKSHKIDKHKWLFIIGIENYEYTDSVKYSSNSAKEFKAVMKKRLGIPENNIRTLINKGATSSKIDYRLKDMLRRVKKGDTIYFYYSGHGIPVPSQNNAPYMLAQDMNPAYLNDERFKLQTIYKELSKSKASKVIAFIDSCFSGGTDNQALIKGVAATRIKPKKTKFDNNKMVVISAGSGTQYSNKYDEKTNRLFSYYIMRGIIKNNTDTRRLYNYVKSNVQEKSYEMGSSYEQVPVYDGNIKLRL